MAKDATSTSRSSTTHPDWRRIYVDPPGTGNTPSHDRIKNQDDMLDVLARVTDDLVGDAAFALAGSVRPVDSTLAASSIATPRASSAYSSECPVSSWIAACARSRSTGRCLQALTRRIGRSRRGTTSRRGRRPTSISSARSAPGYALTIEPSARLEAPTLIVTGRQDAITGYADAWPLLDDYPRATYAVLDRADHDLPIQNEALYRALVSDWLDRMAKHPGA